MPKPGKYTIYYQVALSKEANQKILPQAIEDLISDYQKFGIAKESPKESFKTLKEFAAYIRKNRVGTCLQRSIAAYEDLSNKAIDAVRIVKNEVHAYLEMKIDNYWHARHLGGYPAQLEKMPMDVIAMNKKEQTGITSSSIPDQIKETALDILLKKSQTPFLTIVKDDMDVQSLYTTISQNYPVKDIFVAHDTQSLSLTGQGITAQGEIKPQHTSFRQWLTDHLQKKGIICIDIRQFNAGELAQLNDLLDRCIEDQVLGDHLGILLIDNHARSYYGPDFRRRVPLKNTIHPAANKELLPEMTSSENNTQEVIEIDICFTPLIGNEF